MIVQGGCCTKSTSYFILPFKSITHTEVHCNSLLASPECVPESSFKIYYPFLLVDIVFWYLLSCLIVWVYDKVKKRK